MMRILWVSRHLPLPSQIEALKKLFGSDTEVEQDPNSFDNAQEIAKRFRRSRCHDLVVVAPLSVLDHLVRAGIKPLWAEMVEENNPEFIETRGARGQGYRFDRFRRVVKVEIVFEEL